jgi:methionine-gamma-lyase
MDSQKLGLYSKLVHAGSLEGGLGAAVTPIYQTSTFVFRNAEEGAKRFAGEDSGYIYTRISNPTIGAFEECMRVLEGGAAAVATSSGMGAITVVCLGLLNQGDHVVSTASIYGPSRTLIESHLSRFGVTSTFVDTSNLDEVSRALRPETRLVYIETPSNPMMQVTDIAAVAGVAHQHGALLVVDSTFASPYLQTPLALGADVVLHSVTKFINGHADVVGGVVVSADTGIGAKVRKMMILAGVCMDPHQAFLVHRGIKTLGVRIERAQRTAMEVARWLEDRPEISWVRYVGLPSHPQHDVAKKQMRGFGAMISFEMKGGVEAGRHLMNRVRLALLAVSLGGVETLIEHPASMTHAGVPQAERLEAGISDGLVRYSVGIEDAVDLIEDLRQALEG